ncbi:LAFA_0B02740g1_1 [Lachancea sp. 'fantastica']|nr:LAFA_0B02740g1_1 [Lachancea sp. 'fantastica']
MDGLAPESRIFSTPVKSVSEEKFKSLREKVGRESPYLYRTKQLSDVTKKVEYDGENSASKLSSQSVPITNNTPVKDTVSAEPVPAAFAFENKALGQYSRRIVNKELETRRIISNLVALLLWNLAIKFLTLFLHHTSNGINIQRTLTKWVQELVIYRLFPRVNLEYSTFAHIATIANLSHIFHLIVFYNITVSLWRLVLKSQNVKIDDLHLSDRQKQLLGVSDVPSTKKPLPNLSLSSNIGIKDQKAQLNRPMSPNNNATPLFLFKSLQTPLKSREQSSTVPTSTRSAYVKKVNAFGDLNASYQRKPSLTPGQISSNAFTTPKSRNGYIPSSKYAYMRDSPSPRKTL